MTDENPTPPATDLEVIPDPKSPNWIPSGSSIVHSDARSGEIWKFCCRVRLDMKEEGTRIEDALELLWMMYPHLDFTTKTFEGFLQEFVDPFVVVEATFWKKGLMNANAKLNAVVEISKVAQQMQDAWEQEMDPDTRTEKVPLKDLMTAGKKVIDARKVQAEEMARVGFGPKPEPKDNGKPNIILPPPTTVNVNLGEALGGSFGRSKVQDAEWKEKKP